MVILVKAVDEGYLVMTLTVDAIGYGLDVFTVSKIITCSSMQWI